MIYFFRKGVSPTLYVFALAIFTCVLLFADIGVSIYDHEHPGPDVVLQKLVIDKSPANHEGPTPIKGVSPGKWEKKFSYRISGELKIDETSYRAKHPEDIIIIHRDGSITIYAIEKPSRKEVGPYWIGNDL